MAQPVHLFTDAFPYRRGVGAELEHSLATEFSDSQDDSQAGGRPRSQADEHGISRLVTELGRMLMDCYGP